VNECSTAAACPGRVRCILAATVAMYNHVGIAAAPESCHAQRVLDQLGLHMRLHRPNSLLTSAHLLCDGNASLLMRPLGGLF
jgi:hypothetical protein